MAQGELFPEKCWYFNSNTGGNCRNKVRVHIPEQWQGHRYKPSCVKHADVRQEQILNENRALVWAQSRVPGEPD